jgi:hypothetical protein
MLARTFPSPNIAQGGDAIELLRALSDVCSPLAFFDPQFRSVLDKLAFGNEGARQRGRVLLPTSRCPARRCAAWNRRWSNGHER